MAKSYQKKRKEEQRDEVQDALETCVQEGSREKDAGRNFHNI